MTPEEITKRAWSLVIEAIEEKYRRGGRGGDKTFEAIGKMCGVSKATVKRWRSGTDGGKKTSFSDMLRYFEALGIPLEKIFSDSLPAFAAKDAVIDIQSAPGINLGTAAIAHTGIQSRLKSLYGKLEMSALGDPVPGRDCAYVPLAMPDLKDGKLDVRASRRWPINIDYLKENGGVGNQCMFWVFGDYMDDALPEGSLIMLNLSENDIYEHVRSGHVYLLRVFNDLMVRRLEVRPSGCLMVRPDNPKRGRFVATRQHIENGDLQIFGRMIFNCRVH